MTLKFILKWSMILIRCSSNPSHGALGSHDGCFDLVLDLLLTAFAPVFGLVSRVERADCWQKLYDLVQLGVATGWLARDVDYFFTSLRVEYLGLAKAELSETTESCLEHLNEAGAHVLYQAVFVQVLDWQVQLTQQLTLFDCGSELLQAAYCLGHNQVGVHVAL